MATLKDKINRILGNNVRLLLPSYWWKRVFGLVIDRIDEVENNARITVDSELSKTSKNAVQNKVIAEEFDRQQCVFVVSNDGTVPEKYKQQNKESYNKVYEAIDADRWMNVFVLYGGHFRIQVDSITISGSNEIVLCATADGLFIVFRVSSDGSVVTQNSGSLKIDSSVSSTSTNAVQNKVIKAYVDEKVANSGEGSSVDVDTELSNTSTNPVQNKVITETISAIDARVDDIEDFLEQGSNLTLTIKSNQSSDATISAVKASIKYENKTVESGSGIIGLPAFTTITITFPNVEGYKTPEPITFDTNGHPTSYTAIYETELVNINLSAWDGSSVSGQVITINGKDYTWGDTTISHKVAFGTEYWMYANDKNGYTTKGEKFIASQVSRNVDIVYNAVEGSFITIDQNIADPTTRVSGDIGGEHIQLIRNNSHRYLGKYTADGTMTVCQLDDEDSNYYSDGSSALLDGSQGDVFMKLPKFFYTVHERRPDVYSIGFYYGDNAPSNEWIEWRGDELIGVFKTNDGARSTAVRSSYGLSKDEYSRKAAARGNGYSLIKWKHNGIIAALYFAFYGNTNSQEVIGIGFEAGNRNCGSTASLGMSDTSASEEAINLWGLENWWGAGYEFFENVIYYDDTCIWKITEDDGTVRERKSTINSGFLGQCYIDSHLDFGIERSDSKASYSATTGYCDSYYHWTSYDNERPVLRGALSMSDTGLLGMFTTYSSSDSVAGNYFGGSRICFKGTILTNNDSTAFKALTPIN